MAADLHAVGQRAPMLRLIVTSPPPAPVIPAPRPPASADPVEQLQRDHHDLQLRHSVAMDLLYRERRGMVTARDMLERMNSQRDRAVDSLGRALRHVRLAAATIDYDDAVRPHLKRAEDAIRFGLRGTG